MIFSRNIPLVGEDGQRRLNGSNVLIVGVGGVGGYALEMLTRCGVGSFTIVDMDTVDETNLNRQILALHSTIGRAKTDVAFERMKDINPSVNILPLFKKFTKESEDEIFSLTYDYCVDAIDSVCDKVDLILACKRRGIPCISALGAGNRLTVGFEVKDIFDTSGDGLARAVRTRLRKAGVNSHKTVCSIYKPDISGVPPASISYVPSAMGCVLAQEVIKDLLCL